MADPNGSKITYLGKVDYRNKQLTFGIKQDDRTRHTYIIGKTGMGKSTLLENMIIQDINNGEGICVIDPHGSLAEKLLDFIPESRVKDTIYFAPFDSEHPMGLNILEQVDVAKRHLVANGLMAAFKKIFGEERFSDRIQYILNNIILALLENEGQSLLGVNRMLNDKEYRKFIVSNVKDPSVKSFWEEEYVKAGDKYQQEAAPGIQNKIGQFISNPLIRNIIGQQKTSFDLRDIMDNKKILIVNLSKGKVGEGNANLIGSLLITKIYLAAMSRADAGPYELEKLPPFYFYVDEFQNFANESFASILSESRKYNLALTVAHQYVEQMEDEVKAAVFGNVGTMIAFRVGATDAEAFEKEFAPYFVLDDFVNLSAYQIYLRLMIDGAGSKPFSAHTLGPIPQPPHSFAQAVIAHSRATYSKPVAEVMDEVSNFYKPAVKEARPPENGGENHLKVREIRNDTPLPRHSDSNSNSRHPRQEDRRAHADDRRSHADDKREQPERRQGERRDLPAQAGERRGDRPQTTDNRQQTAQISSSIPTAPAQFDERPAMSLKEALAKAMSENNKTTDQRSQTTENPDSFPKASKENIEARKEEAAQKKREVAEEVLRRLVQDE